MLISKVLVFCGWNSIHSISISKYCFCKCVFLCFILGFTGHFYILLQNFRYLSLKFNILGFFLKREFLVLFKNVLKGTFWAYIHWEKDKTSLSWAGPSSANIEATWCTKLKKNAWIELNLIAQMCSIYVTFYSSFRLYRLYLSFGCRSTALSFFQFVPTFGNLAPV